MNTKAILDGISVIIPELVVTGLMIVLIFADLLKKVSKPVLPFIAFMGLLAAGAAVGFMVWKHPVNAFRESALAFPTTAFSGAFAHDRFSLFFRGLFLATAAAAVLFSAPVVSKWKSGQGEFYALLMSCTLGMMFMAGANDLLMMYLSLEFASVTSYIMSGLLRKNRKSSEASLKYIIYGAAASGFMIYGMTFLYGLTGTLDIHQIGAKIAELNAAKDVAERVPQTMTLITSVLIMAGFSYKIAAVPFHMWCPDVYEGAPTPVTAFFSVGPKAAGFAMLARFLGAIFPAAGAAATPFATGEAFEWKLVIALVSVLTMALGNLAALLQQNLKRLFAYSSIAHSGYMLLTLTVFTPGSIAALMFYLTVYVLMNLGAFIIVIVLEEKYGIETVDDCRGLGWRAPAIGILMTIFLFSLTGLPPTAGFVGKLLIFSELIQNGGRLGLSLCVVAVVFTVISLYYYARIVGAMFLVKPREGLSAQPAGGLYTGLLWALAAATIFFGLWWGPLQGFTTEAAKDLIPRL